MSLKAHTLTEAVRQALGAAVQKAERLVLQSRQRKAPAVRWMAGTPKLYAWHAPEVECISKGKAKQPYEFGVKVGIAATLRGNLIVGTRSFAGNPY